MPAVNLKQGNPIMVDHTPGSAVAAGDVVVTSSTPRVAHRAIAANELGALAAMNGIYECTGDAAIGADVKVYWNAAAGKVTTTASTHKVFGVTVSACSGDNATCLVLHNPGTL